MYATRYRCRATPRRTVLIGLGRLHIGATSRSLFEQFGRQRKLVERRAVARGRIRGLLFGMRRASRGELSKNAARLRGELQAPLRRGLREGACGMQGRTRCRRRVQPRQGHGLLQRLRRHAAFAGRGLLRGGAGMQQVLAKRGRDLLRRALTREDLRGRSSSGPTCFRRQRQAGLRLPVAGRHLRALEKGRAILTCLTRTLRQPFALTRDPPRRAGVAIIALRRVLPSAERVGALLRANARGLTETRLIRLIVDVGTLVVRVVATLIAVICIRGRHARLVALAGQGPVRDASARKT
jgi:hypothetical protein